MHSAPVSPRRRWLAAILLLLVVATVGAGLFLWQRRAANAATEAAKSQPEHTETVTTALAESREHRRTTVAIGTVTALQSITLHNELPGTVHEVKLVPGQVVEPGTLLVALDVAVEEAELRALEAEVALAESWLDRMTRASSKNAAPAADLDRAKSQRDVAMAHAARTKAVIARKTIRAPFRGRVGVSNVHIGQFLRDGTELTTLQGVDEAVHIDFTVTQAVAQQLRAGDTVEVLRASAGKVGAAGADPASIVALDSRVDAKTRNAIVRARLEAGENVPAPGAAVRVRVPVGAMQKVVTVPVTALRRGPSGDHVFVVEPDTAGVERAQIRPVKSGTMLGDEVVVHEGLNAGERVAASGSFKLFPGVRVNVATPPANGRAN